MPVRPDSAFTVRLPSGARAKVTGRRVSPPPTSLPAALRASAVEADVDLEGLCLADAHVIEALLVAAGVVVVPPLELECRNCARKVVFAVAEAIPTRPLLDPPGDEELDRALLGEQEHPLRAPVPIRGEPAQTFRLGARTLRDRIRLEQLLGDDPRAPLPLGGPLIRAMGLVALGATRSPTAIARALEALDDDTFEEAWDAIAEAFDRQHWPPRLLVPTACPSCGACHDLEAAGPRPFTFFGPRTASGAPFPPLETFQARAAELVTAIFADEDPADLAGLEVTVEEGVPPCDDGGEPLLGSYTPSPEADGDVRGPAAPFRIQLYYRTFQSMYADEPYDWEAEIRDTIEHELEHHHNFLSGHDPLDEAEHAAIAHERERLHGRPGARELTARLPFLFADFARFVRAIWPLLALVFVGLLGYEMCGR
ncbi:MAG: metallopeptidase family protein [Myxococcales bacterium]|nr:metallopeptidase family protein [Myxococcales bacterium]